MKSWFSILLHAIVFLVQENLSFLSVCSKHENTIRPEFHATISNIFSLDIFRFERLIRLPCPNLIAFALQKTL